MCCLFLFYTYHQHEILTKLFKYLTVNKTSTEMDVWVFNISCLGRRRRRRMKDYSLSLHSSDGEMLWITLLLGRHARICRKHQQISSSNPGSDTDRTRRTRWRPKTWRCWAHLAEDAAPVGHPDQMPRLLGSSGLHVLLGPGGVPALVVGHVLPLNEREWETEQTKSEARWRVELSFLTRLTESCCVAVDPLTVPVTVATQPVNG